MRLADIGWVLIGVVLIAWALGDVFQSVIVPRAVTRYRLSAQLIRTNWRLWSALSWHFFGSGYGREDFLATFAPLTLILVLLFWVTTLVLGYGLVLWGLREQLAPHVTSLATAVYFAATSILTIGFGEIVPRGAWARFFAVSGAVTGLAVLSITTAFLFAVFGSFQQREQFVVAVGARAGSPPSGVGLLEIAGVTGLIDDLPRVMRDAQLWAAAVMETHLAYPILAYFRSSHDDASWVGTLGTLLDAATLMITTIDMPCGQARIFYNIGRHAALDLSRYFQLQPDKKTAGVEREEFELACDGLRAAGLKLKDRDVAWIAFVQLRADYAGQLNALARRFEIPPLKWIGDRSFVTAPHITTINLP